MLAEIMKLTEAITNLYSPDQHRIGASPGEVKLKDDSFPPLEMNVINYNAETFSAYDIDNVGDAVELREKDLVSWLIVNGFGGNDFLLKLKDDLGFHGLVIEDIVNRNQPPKIEFLNETLFMGLRLAASSSSRLDTSISIIISGSNLYLFCPSERFKLGDKLVKRIKGEKGMIRKKGIDYLLFAIIDLVVDSYFPKIDVIANSIKEIDQSLFEGSNSHLLKDIKTIRQVLNVYYDNLHPIKDIVDKLLGADDDFIKAENVKYYNHALNHVSYLCERITRLKEATSDIMNLNISMNGQKMNEIMKMLTMMSSIFIPLSFLCGLYGMNFDTSKSSYNMPELSYAYGYPILLGVMGCVVAGMFYYFYRKRWF